MDEQALDRVARLWADARGDLEGTADELDTRVRTILARLIGGNADFPDRDFRYRWIEGRIKQYASIVRNLQRANLGPEDIWSIDDMVGVRVVVVTRSDVRALVDAIRSDSQLQLDGLKETLLEEHTGYRATHLKGWHRRGQYRIGCEIQIRTALEDAWAVVSRSDLYGRENIPEVIARMAQIEARHLAAGDEALELIRNEAARTAVRTPAPSSESPAQTADQPPSV